MTEPDVVTVPRAALEALWHLYDCWANVATVEPPREQIEKGMSEMLERGDSLLMEQAFSAVDPYEEVLLAALAHRATELLP